MLQNIKFLLHVFLGPLFSYGGHLMHSNALIWGGFALLILTTACNQLIDPD